MPASHSGVQEERYDMSYNNWPDAQSEHNAPYAPVIASPISIPGMLSGAKTGLTWLSFTLRVWLFHTITRIQTQVTRTAPLYTNPTMESESLLAGILRVNPLLLLCASHACLPPPHFLPNAATRTSRPSVRPNLDRRLTRLVPTMQLAPIRGPLRPLPAPKRP